MNLTDILLVVVIILLLMLFVSVPVVNIYHRMRGKTTRKAGKWPPPARANAAREAPPAETDPDGHDLSGGMRVEEPAGALESGYRRVDPAQDLASTQAMPGKKNGKPH